MTLTSQIVQAILEPFKHISTVPGKDIRGLMLAAFNTWLNVPDDKMVTISQVIKMLHNASLLYVFATHRQIVLV